MLKTFECYTHYPTLYIQKQTYKNTAVDLAQVKRTESGFLDHWVQSPVLKAPRYSIPFTNTVSFKPKEQLGCP